LNEINTILLPRNTSGNNYNFGFISPYELVITKSVDGVAQYRSYTLISTYMARNSSNLGTGTARNIIVDDQIPTGFVTLLWLHQVLVL
jgi:hypothetical protein